MSKWYEVVVEANKTVTIEVEDGESDAEAKKYAEEEAWGMDAGDVSTISCEELTGEENISLSKRHADNVFSL